MMGVKITSHGSSSAGNCYIIDDGARSIMIECGVRVSSLRAAGVNLSNIDACLISHEHGDHTKYHKDISKAGIKIFCSKGTGAAIGIEENYKVQFVEAKTVYHKTPSRGWQLMPFDTVHDAVEPLGFLLTNGKIKLLFATDTAFLKYKFAGLTHLMIECNFQPEILQQNVEAGTISPTLAERIKGNHFGLGSLIEFFKANDTSKLAEVHLLHLSNGQSSAKECERIVREELGKPVFICAA